MDNANAPAGANPSGIVTKKFAVSEATKVELIGPGSATITRGATGVLSVSGRPADFEHLEIKTAGASVKVQYHGGLIRNRGPEGQLRYELVLPILEELKASDGLSIEASNIDSRDLKVELKGKSSLSLTDLRASEFEANVTDEGRLTVAGAVVSQKVKLDGGSTYQGAGVHSEESEIEAAGKSEATVRVSKKLKAKASEGSTIAYSGEGIDLSVQTSDGSVFRHLTS